MLLQKEEIDAYVTRFEDWSLLPKTPMVTVQISIFNHEKYIRKTFESILMQKVSFEYEILIKEDKSTDNTREIVLEFQQKYPDKFRIWAAKNNLHNQGVKLGLVRFARGKYLAKLDGDDYWTDSLKLQKQFNFMQKNKGCSLVFHLANRINTENKVIGVHGPKSRLDQCFFDINDAILKCDTLVPTNSMFYETNHLKNLPNWLLKAPVGDLPLTLLLAHHGKLGFINELMSNYRVMTQSSWSKKMLQSSTKRKIHDQKIKIMWIEFDAWSNFSYSKLIRKVLILTNYRILKRELKIKCSSFFNNIKKY